jgi:hypothetical protein
MKSRGSRMDCQVSEIPRMLKSRFAYQVVSQELHDEGGVLVALLAESVKLCEKMC